MQAALAAELAKAEPDLAAVAAVGDDVQAKNLALRHQVRDAWLAVYSTFSPDQLEEVLRVTLKIARRLARRIGRRRRPSARRGRIDLRRTLRANLTRGELIDLRYRRRKRKKVRLVLLCDVSGSMDLYSRFLLQFLFALQSAFSRVETFTFSVRLTRVTDYLRARSYREVLRRLTAVRDWSGERAHVAM